MATEMPVFTTSDHSADADLSTKQYHLVKDTATGIALCSGVTDRPAGVLQNNPAQGETAVVMRIGRSKIVAGGAVAKDANIGTDATGRAAAKTLGTDTTHFVVGSNSEAAAAAGNIVSAYINCIGAGRAA